MPEVAGMQAKAVMHIVAVTPATSSSKDDINSMTATTVENSWKKTQKRVKVTHF
jgi:hypothetical protein